jgi:alkylation response protein AidB-like acyl-CoA dehydrogenase
MTDALAAARDLFDLVDSNARQTRHEPVPQATVDALVDAGLHAVMTPRAVGGLEASIVEAIDVFAEISRADGSTGWCLMANAATVSYFGAWAADDFAQKLFADGVPLTAGQFAPNGVATPDGDGYRITGNFQFAAASDIHRGLARAS